MYLQMYHRWGDKHIVIQFLYKIVARKLEFVLSKL